MLSEVALHVIQRGHNRQPCFRQETDFLVYLTILDELARKTGCALHAYCLMTNHVHLMLTPPGPAACATFMRNLGQRYVQYFDRRYLRSGTLWEGRFRSCLVDSADYVLACYRYIELNPVRAGMIPTSSAYRWSSHNGNCGRIRNKLLSPHPDYIALAADDSSRQAAYAALFDKRDESGFLTAIREATNGGFPLVGEELKSRVAAMGRQIEAKRPGPHSRSEPSLDVISGELGL